MPEPTLRGLPRLFALFGNAAASIAGFTNQQTHRSVGNSLHGRRLRAANQRVHHAERNKYAPLRDTRLMREQALRNAMIDEQRRTKERSAHMTRALSIANVKRWNRGVRTNKNHPKLNDTRRQGCPSKQCRARRLGHSILRKNWRPELPYTKAAK